MSSDLGYHFASGWIWTGSYENVLVFDSILRFLDTCLALGTQLFFLHLRIRVTQLAVHNLLLLIFLIFVQKILKVVIILNLK